MTADDILRSGPGDFRRITQLTVQSPAALVGFCILLTAATASGLQGADIVTADLEAQHLSSTRHALSDLWLSSA